MSDKSEKPWFHAPPELWEKLKPLAREMRHESTPAEDALWQRLRNRQMMGLKFRRQYGIEARLIIEVDGDIHDKQQESDAVRQTFLESQGFRVLRFRNEEVLTEMDGVLSAIAEALSENVSDENAKADLTPQPPLRVGEGEQPPRTSPLSGTERGFRGEVNPARKYDPSEQVQCGSNEKSN